MSGYAQTSLFDEVPTSPIGQTPALTRRLDVDISAINLRQDVLNYRLLKDLVLVGPYEVPRIGACQAVPDRLIAFSEALALKQPDQNAWVHFYEDDYRFIRLWRRPEAYFPQLSGFAGVISPDFSLHRNASVSQKIECNFKNQLIGARMQADGINVIANVRLSGRKSIPYALAGSPRESTVAVGLHGCIKDLANRAHVAEELRIICDELSPSNLIIYGNDAYQLLDYPRERGVAVHVFSPDTYDRSRQRGEAA